MAGIKAAQKSNEKEFQYFSRHHKQGAGAKARLLKTRLESTAGVKLKVFIDSDNLKDLTKLQYGLHDADHWCYYIQVEACTAYGVSWRLQQLRTCGSSLTLWTSRSTANEQKTIDTYDTYDTH